eukprot:1237238-Pyramimonas_sp.AAC.1
MSCGKLWAARTSATCATSMRYARSTEKVKPTFVHDAITVHERLLPLEVSNRCLVWAEENMMGDSPWKSIYAIQAVVERASIPNGIKWAMEGLTDHCRMGRGRRF